MLPTTFGEFRVVAAPELRFTPSGKGVASVRLVASKGKKNDDGQWEDTHTVWLNGTMWNSDHGREAENLCESVDKGDLVEVRGQLFQRDYETKDGEKRTSLEVNMYACAPSLRFNPAKPVKSERGASSEPATGVSGAPADDPWAVAPDASAPPF